MKPVMKTVAMISRKLCLFPSSANIIEELYHLAEHSYLGAYDRYKVLSSQSVDARFNLLYQLLRDLDEMYTAELKLRNQTD